MLYFDSDYMEGAHPAVLQNLVQTNEEQTVGYGEDQYCESARAKIRKACRCPDAEVHFAVGGTQANMLILATLLRSWQAVISADTGHIAGHEAGAIERTGHKVITLPHTDGKITAEAVRQYIQNYYADSSHEHAPEPGAVYISHPTEYGTLYTAAELRALNETCRSYSIPLFADGARLGYALAAEDSDITLPLLAEYTDVFYIGGTKVGALFGEAIVFTTPEKTGHFFSIMKQHGALLAKGRLLGIQFDTLFTDNLYLKIGRNAVETAGILKTALKQKKYKLMMENPTNQIFAVIGNKKLEELSKHMVMRFWEKYDDGHTVVRFVTSWATKREDAEKAAALL